MQKYEKFLKRVLDGRTQIEYCRWIDLNYHSSVFPGNPDVLLINHLKEEHRNGRLAAHNPLRPINTVRAPNGSLSSGQYRALPPYTMAGKITILINETTFF